MSSNQSNSNESESAKSQISLQETYEHLKTALVEMQIEIDELTETIRNNPSLPLNENTTEEDILRKQQQFLESLEKLALEEVPKNYPIPETKDMNATVMQNLEEIIQNKQQLMNRMNRNLSNFKSEVSYLEDKIKGYERMKQAALNANENQAKVTYEEEYALSKRIFSEVKKNLAETIDIIFPEINDFMKFLSELSKKHFKGGDDVYIDINRKNFFITQQLEILGIISYHPNDKNMCKMVNLL